MAEDQDARIDMCVDPRVDVEAAPAAGMLRRALDLWPTSPAKAFFRTQEAVLFSAVDVPAPAVDLGCGDGEFASLLPHRLAVGVDADPTRVKAARRAGTYRFALRADLARLPLRDGVFTCAIANSVLEHVDNLEAVLGEARRVLRTGGRLLFTIPTPRMREWLPVAEQADACGRHELARSIRSRFDAYWMHRRYLDRDDIRSVLLDSGFTDVSVTEYEPRAAARLADLLAGVTFDGSRYRDLAAGDVAEQTWRAFLYELMLPLLSTTTPGAGAGLFCAASKV